MLVDAAGRRIQPFVSEAGLAALHLNVHRKAHLVSCHLLVARA